MTETTLTLTPRKLADAIGVSESSVKRWVDGGRIPAARTAGGHRRIALADAVSYVREHRLPVRRPDLLGLPELSAVGGPDGDLVGERLFALLRRGEGDAARGLLIGQYLAGRSAAQLVDGPLAQAMARIGELWRADPAGVFQEHRATQIALEGLAALRGLISPPTGARLAVGGAPEGDRYWLAPLAVAVVLEDEGLQVRHLGAETPVSALAQAVEEYDARLAYLSVSVASRAERLRRELEGWLPELEARGTLLVVGGAAAGQLGLGRHDALYVGRSMAELAALVRGARLAPGAPAPGPADPAG